MNEYIKWGGAGIALALVGVVAIASEIQHGLSAGDPLPVIYGGAVVFAALVTILIVAPSFRESPDPSHD
ncbi:hypothetical protein [Halohasta litorea]|uniref:Uncharacterized protein n=1 Tax=Halohasta litorea TaxID=869891 RepID=A0ABD6D5N3_9EURY|nr:hypothetical protein [Halohasta litorea]